MTGHEVDMVLLRAVSGGCYATTRIYTYQWTCDTVTWVLHIRSGATNAAIDAWCRVLLVFTLVSLTACGTCVALQRHAIEASCNWARACWLWARLGNIPGLIRVGQGWVGLTSVLPSPPSSFVGHKVRQSLHNCPWCEWIQFKPAIVLCFRLKSTGLLWERVSDP